MCAYYYVRHDNKFSKICSSLMSASMIIPFQAIMIPLVYIYGAKMGMLNHRATLIFMHTGFAMSMSVFILGPPAMTTGARAPLTTSLKESMSPV